MPRWLLVALLAACEPEPSCYIDHVVERHIGAEVVTDCGSITFDRGRFDVALYDEIRTCVLDSVMRSVPFQAAWHEYEFESQYFDRYVGLVRDGRFEISAFSMDVAPDGPDGDMINLPTHRRTCATLVEQGGCMREYETLCLSCASPVERESCPD